MKRDTHFLRQLFSMIFSVVIAVSPSTPKIQVKAVERELMRQAKDESGAITVKLRFRLAGHKRRVGVLGFSPDGRTLATGAGDREARLWDVATGQLRTALMGDRYVGGLSFSPDGRTLATWSYAKTVWLWDVATGQLKERLMGRNAFIDSVAFSANGQTVATASLKELIVRLWNTQTGQVEATLPHEKECGYCGESIGNVEFNPDGRTLATSSYHNCYIWDVATKQLKTKLVDQNIKSQRVRVISHGREQQQVRTFSHADTIYRMKFSPDGRTLATGSRDFTAKLWDASTGQLKATFKHKGRVLCLAFSQDSEVLATGSEDGTAKLWDVVTGQLKATLNHRGTVWSIAFSPDGKLVATGADHDSVKLWDAATGRLLEELKTARYPVSFSPDGRILATAGQQGQALLWQVSLY